MRKFFVALIGGTVLLLGFVLLFLPGPGALVIAAGFAILATEFLWARRAWRNAKGKVSWVRRKSGFRARWQKYRARSKTKSPAGPPASPPAAP